MLMYKLFLTECYAGKFYLFLLVFNQFVNKEFVFKIGFKVNVSTLTLV